MRWMLIAATVFLCAAPPAMAQPASETNPQIDYAGFVRLAQQVQLTRAQHLLPLDEFQALAQRDDVLLLDARSAADFAAGHIDGAVNLPLPEFTAQSLAETIGSDRGRRILIYCNNNFTDNVAPVVRKAVMLALNIQTMINLNGYGYPNVFELGEAVSLDDARVRWVGGDRSRGA